MRAVLVEQTPEEREETMDVFMKAMSNNECRRLMEAVERIDPGFVEWGLERLEEAKRTSTTYKRVDIHGEDHLLGNTPEKIIEGKGKVAELLKQLDAEGFTCKDISVFSVATALASMFNAACLRPQDYFNLLAKTLYYNRKLHRLMIGLPDAGKQTKAAEKQQAKVCMEHGVEGPEVVRWWVMMSLVGRPFLKKHNDGWVDPRFGPMGTNGKVLSEKVFRTIFTQMGRLFFATGNVDVNALRTVQDTLAVEHIIELGMTTDAICITDLAREQRTSTENLTNAYNLRIVDATSLPVKHDGPVPFKGGVRKMIDARRVRHGRGSETSSDAGDSDVSGGGGGEAPVLASDGPLDDFDVQFIQVQREVAFEEMKARLKELKAEDGATSTGATGAAGGAAPVADGVVASAAPVPVAPEQGRRGPYKKAVRKSTPAEQDGIRKMVEAIGMAYQRAKARGPTDPVMHYMSRPRNYS
ncbi:unnamed protein product [Ectocarpus sp. 12 AP-2014]